MVVQQALVFFSLCLFVFRSPYTIDIFLSLERDDLHAAVVYQ
jgi:hypothetical protein